MGHVYLQTDLELPHLNLRLQLGLVARAISIKSLRKTLKILMVLKSIYVVRQKWGTEPSIYLNLLA